MRPPQIEVLQRPGCPFCARLQRDLARAGVSTVDHDIWADPDAATRVRQVTGGDETVPTVIVGSRALVNPRLPQVLSAVREEFPDDVEELLGDAAHTAAAPPWREGALAAAAVVLLWVALALWRPDTTWHLAPFLAAAAPPWLLARRGDLDAATLTLLRRVGAVSAAAVLAVTGALWAAGLLRGPLLTGAGPAVVEAALLAVLGPAVVVGLATRRARRR